jgi:hypothetical protein
MNLPSPIPHRSLRDIALILLALIPFESGFTWQQRVVYSIDVLLDPEERMLMGNEVLRYVNNSPDTLNQVWFHLYPNAFRDRNTEFAQELCREGKSDFYFSSPEEKGYIDILSLDQDGIPLIGKITGTEMRADLLRPIPPGDSATFEMHFIVRLPHMFHHLGYEENRYHLSSWYPKMAAYDEEGWHVEGYHLIPNLYADFGTFDVTITLPQQYVVAATGELVGPREEFDRLSSLEAYSRSPRKERRGATHPYSRGGGEADYKSLTFHAENVNDFAWTASTDYLLFRESIEDLQIDVLLLPGDERKMKDAVTYAKEAATFYRECFGPYPYGRMTVVDGGDFDTRGLLAPNVPFVSNRSPMYTKLTEMEVAHQVARQWFRGVLGNDPECSLWLDEGFATYSTLRYMEEKYGDEYSLLDLPLDVPYLPEVDAGYLADLHYYLFASTGYETAICTPTHQRRESGLAYQTAAYKGALVLSMLRDLLGPETFDVCLETYRQRYMFKNPSSDDFISVCEEVSGQKLHWFFQQWLGTTDRCDYEVKSFRSRKLKRSPYEENPPGNYRNQIRLKRNQPVVMPLEVAAYTKTGDQYRRAWDSKETEKTLTFFSWEKIERVALDPEKKVLDYYRWNNYKPRKYSFKLFWDKPSFDTYQLFFMPYAFYSPNTELQLGGILMGSQFLLAGPILGRHQWSFAPIYSTGKKTFRHSARYQTPLGRWGPFTKLSLGWSRSWDYLRLSAGVSSEKREKLLGEPRHNWEVFFSHKEVKSITDQDRRDFQVGQYSGVNMAYGLRRKSIRSGGSLEAALSLAKDLSNDTFQFGKASVEPQLFYRWSRGTKTELRLYGGHAWGDVPLQEYFYLSGKLIPEGLFAFTWESTGELSPQERWHLWGDANLRGYFGRHLKGKTVASVTVEHTLPYLPAYLFLDAGNVYREWGDLDLTDIRSDFGVGFRFFVLRIDFPIWVSHPENEGEWKLRWIVGLTKGWQ